MRFATLLCAFLVGMAAGSCATTDYIEAHTIACDTYDCWE